VVVVVVVVRAPVVVVARAQAVVAAGDNRTRRTTRMRSNAPCTELNMDSMRETVANKVWRGMIPFAAAIAMLTASATAGSAAAQKTFGSPDEAVKELVAAAKTNDSKAMLGVLGPEAKSVIFSGDAVADRADRERFVKSYEEANKLEMSGDAKALIVVGKDEWPFPIPIIKVATGWRFDARQGREELLNRRIGRNELAVIQVVQAVVDAQQEYYLRNPTHDKLLHYAQTYVSTKGRKDGLFFPTREGELPSPLGQLVAKAQASGYKPGEANNKPNPYYGYYYRILKAQGPDAPGGAYDYVVRGKMIGGFALVAYPATYANSGVMTFIVNHAGVVYEKDLGPGTSSIARKMTKFNPDATWKRI
jgi:DUF2950 family protein